MASQNSPSKRGITLLGAALGGIATYSALTVPRQVPLPLSIATTRREFYGPRSAQLSYYVDEDVSGAMQDAPARPLLLIHSINAAASAYEMQPLFDYYRGRRPVYALELPGFGFAERSDRRYSAALYVNAILDFIDLLDQPCDAIALSLGCEFLAQAAQQQPDAFHSLTFISPTGLGNRETGSPSDTVYSIVRNPLWSQPLYDLLVSRPSLRAFLRMNFVDDVDREMLEYAWRTSHQPGARFAPLSFISGRLFTPGIYDDTYLKLAVPTLVLYDEDPNTGFDRVPDLLLKTTTWRARRIVPSRGLPHFEKLTRVVEALSGYWDDLEATASPDDMTTEYP